MKIILESRYGSTEVSASVDMPDVEATGEELEWLALTFRSLIAEGILGKREK